MSMLHCQVVNFAIPAYHRVKTKENEKIDKYLYLARILTKLRYMRITVIPIIIGALGTVTGGIRNKRTSGDHPNYRIIEIDQNIEKSPGALRRLAVTQIPAQNNPLTHESKTRIISNGSPNPGQMTRPHNNQQKK